LGSRRAAAYRISARAPTRSPQGGAAAGGQESAAERREEPRRSSRGPLCPQGTGSRGRRGQSPRRRRAKSRPRRESGRASSTRSRASGKDSRPLRRPRPAASAAGRWPKRGRPSPGRRFPWGDTIQLTWANYAAHSAYWYDTSGYIGQDPIWITEPPPYTSPAGSFPPNGYGLYDVIGNAWEWCWDWYASSYSSGSVTNPQGPASGTNRVARGGGCGDYPPHCQVAARGVSTVGVNYGMGFRTVLP